MIECDAVAMRTWPSDWNDRMAGSGCPICSALSGGDNDYWVHVVTGDVTEVHLERRSPVPGYCGHL